MAPFYGWGSTASRLEPIWGSNLLFPNKFPKVPGTQFINVRRIKVFDERRISGPESPCGFEHRTPGLGIQHLDD